MNIDIFILARSASNRLPKKHFQQVNGKSVIENLVNRMKKGKDIRKIVVCTTDLPSDDEFVKMLKEKNIEYFRGSEKDVIKRLYDAAKFFDTDIVIDVSGDKIYTDVEYVNKVTHILQNEDVDFVRGSRTSSKFDPSDLFVHGFIPGGFTKNSLEKILKNKKNNNTEDGYTEYFISDNTVKKKFIVPNVDFKQYDKIKLDLDYPDDLELARKIFENLGNDFHLEDILNLFSKKAELKKESMKNLDKWKQNYSKKISISEKIKN